MMNTIVEYQRFNMGYIQPSMKKNVVDMAEYKGRKARRQIDQSHNPSRKVTMTDVDETRGDDAPPHGIPRPTGAGKINVWTE